MPKGWDIGKEARELDEKKIMERIRLEKRSIKKVIFALMIYFLTMYIFYIFL